MKTNKKIVVALAVIGALMFMSAFGAVLQSDNSSADDVVTYEVTFTETDGVAWFCDGDEITDYTPLQIEAGTKIMVAADPKDGYVGTPAIKAGSATYNAGTNYYVNADVTFTVTGIQPEIKVMFTVTPGVAWSCNGDPVLDGQYAVVGAGTKINVVATLKTGFTGAITIKANGEPYTADTEYQVNEETTFTASGAELQSIGVSFEETPGITWSCNDIQVTGTIPVNYGDTIKVAANVDDGFEGTPEITVGDESYAAGTAYNVTSSVTFSATGVTEVVDTPNDDGGGNSMVLYIAIIVIVLVVVCIIAWFLWFKKP